MFAIKSYLAVFLTLIATSFFTLPANAVELVMVEQMGCEWCERWDEEIGPIYPKTTEGKFAPLRRVDIYEMLEDLTVARRVNFTPTFLIVEDGKEIARLEGYPGADFFWPVLTSLLKKNTNYDPSPGAGG